jgi:hypothetical protein
VATVGMAKDRSSAAGSALVAGKRQVGEG